MVRSTAEFIIVRNEFYARSYRQIKKIVTILLLTFTLLIGFAIYQNNNLKATPRYFPTTPDGKLIEMPPIDENHLLLGQQKVNPETGIIYGMPQPTKLYSELQSDGDNALVLYWAYLAVSNMFDYDYINYRKVIQNSSRYFTAMGSQNFRQALMSSRNLETVKARSAVVVPVITGNVKLLGTKMFDGHFVWDIQVPIQLTYESVADPQPIVQNLLATMSIARVSTLLCPFYGLAIYKLNFQETAAPAVPAVAEG